MSARWWDGRMTAFDVETTGVDVEQARIVTAAVAGVGGGSPTAAQEWLVNPGVPIPTGASEVHGITDEMAAGGTPAAEAVEVIVSTLEAACRLGQPIVAFNARFDLTVLDREARRHYVKPLCERRTGGLYVIDPLVLDKWLDKFRRGSRKLDAVCEHYGVELGNAHDAGADAIAAARVAWCMGNGGEVKRRVRNAADGRELASLRTTWERVRGSLQDLHETQVVIAAEQAASLEAYFARKGEPQTVERAWPMVPVCPRCNGTMMVSGSREEFDRSGGNPEFEPDTADCPACA